MLERGSPWSVHVECMLNLNLLSWQWGALRENNHERRRNYPSHLVFNLQEASTLASADNWLLTAWTSQFALGLLLASSISKPALETLDCHLSTLVAELISHKSIHPTSCSGSQQGLQNRKKTEGFCVSSPMISWSPLQWFRLTCDLQCFRSQFFNDLQCFQIIWLLSLGRYFPASLPPFGLCCASSVLCCCHCCRWTLLTNHPPEGLGLVFGPQVIY